MTVCVGVRHTVSAALSAVGLCLVVAAARADDVPYVQLAYEVAPEVRCPDERYLRDALTSRMGYDPVRPEGQGRVEVRVVAAGAGSLSAVVTFQPEPTAKTTRRALAANDGRCVDLVQAVAVTLAILVDPFGEHRERGARAAEADRASRAIEPKTSAPAQTAEAPERVQSSEVRDAASPPPRTPVHLEAWGAGVASLGRVPELGLGGAVGAFVRRGAVAAGLYGLGETTPAAVELGRGRVSASLLGGGLEACFAGELARVCAIGALGSYAGRDDTVASPVTRRALYAEAGVRAALRVRLASRLGLVAFVEGAVPLVRPELVVDGEVVHRASVVTGTLGIGPSIEVPGW